MDIKLALYDFDGVMTDNKVIVDQNGLESVLVNRSDGLAIRLIKDLGIKQIIISTEENKVVSMRAKKLNIDCNQNVMNKQSVVKEISRSNNIALENIAFIGNDINDLDAMMICGYPLCPLDARQEIIKISYKVLPSLGGCGVIRDFYDLLIE